MQEEGYIRNYFEKDIAFILKHFDCHIFIPLYSLTRSLVDYYELFYGKK